MAKKSGKQAREQNVLLGLVDHYIKTCKPVGSNTLKEEAGFADLSSATIRNYFANLEKQGFLTQQHTSGGRVPTAAAYRMYADHALSSYNPKPGKAEEAKESREIAQFLQEAAEQLSKETNCAVFMSAPRFDHDFVSDIKLVPIDINRYLSVLITDFGVIQTELMRAEQKVSAFFLKRLEAYFHWRLTGHDEPENLTPEEEKFAQDVYNELMVRFIVGYSSFTDEDLLRNGFSHLLVYPEFQETAVLANTLALFENLHTLRLLLRETVKKNTTRFWIADDLNAYTKTAPECSVLTSPYLINQQPAGALGIIGPTRLPYEALFASLHQFSKHISQVLTKSVYKFKISFRQPQEDNVFLQKEEHKLLGQSKITLLTEE